MPVRPFPPAPPVLGVAGYSNVCKSVGVSRGVKISYLKALEKCGLDKAQAENEHKRRCAGNARKGCKPKALDPNEGLGVVVPENKFIEHTAAAFGRSISAFAKDVAKWISYHEKRARGEDPTEDERLVTFAFMRARVPTRSDGSVWLFRNPSRNRNAFLNIGDEWIGHRLGLKLSRKRETRLAFSFRAGHIDDPRLPTYRDVAWEHMELWRWNGKTQPLPRTPSGYDGLDELVAVPPELGRLDQDIFRIKLQKR
jgi:hypothetical protein